MQDDEYSDNFKSPSLKKKLKFNENMNAL